MLTTYLNRLGVPGGLRRLYKNITQWLLQTFARNTNVLFVAEFTIYIPYYTTVETDGKKQNREYKLKKDTY